MKLIVGLGNPGKYYEKTRHNIGFIVIDKYLRSNNWQTKFNAEYMIVGDGPEKAIFLKPQTYMNLSGNSVRSFVDYYNIDLNNILVIHDDLDLPCGSYRLKINSSHGGHNGIKSIITSLGSNSFARLKIGISKSVTEDTKNYVLGQFTKDELDIIESNINIYNQIIKDFLTTPIIKLMNDYNRKINK